ncbi:MAG: hypothetical protein N2203_07220 [Bacteroidia bacterium]|nr:hypothetical protein [Bacteroidia bacterium]
MKPYTEISSQQFIIQWLNNLVKEFPSIHIKYTTDSLDNTHYIFIEPYDEYLQGQLGEKIWDFDIHQFIPNFPEETLAFLSMQQYDNLTDKPILFEFRPSAFQISPDQFINPIQLILDPVSNVILSTYLHTIKTNKIKIDISEPAEITQSEKTEYAA